MPNFYQQICETFIKPCRQIYNQYDLGQSSRQFGKRIDFQVNNNREYKLFCSFYSNIYKPLAPCVVYLHSLNGSRLQSLPFVDQVLAKQFNFCTFDFSGTGLSQGQYVSLGFHQKYDISTVLDHLSNKFNIKHFYLWGRSMGAVAAVKYLSMMTNPSSRQSRIHKDYKINGLILDSPFQSLRQLTIQIAKQKINIPQIFIKAALLMIQSSIQQKAGFRISQMQLLDDVKYIQCPTLLLTSKDDKLVLSTHSQKIYQAITHKDREIMFIKGEHNAIRQYDTIANTIQFILKDVRRRIAKCKVKTPFVKSSNIINCRMNHLTASIVVASKSSKKLNNISMEGMRFDTVGDEQLTCGRVDDEVEQEQKIKEFRGKQYKKALQLYSPKVVTNSQKKLKLREANPNRSIKILKFKSPIESQKHITQKQSLKNELKLKMDKNYQYQSQKKINNNCYKINKSTVQINKSYVKQQPKFYLDLKQDNQNTFKIIPMTPQKKYVANQKYLSALRQSLIQTEQKDFKLQLKNQITQGNQKKFIANTDVNHFNIIGEKLRKKKRKEQLRYHSPKPIANPDLRFLGYEVEGRQQFSANTQSSIVHSKIQQYSQWKAFNI